MPKADLPWPARIRHGRYLLFLVVLAAAAWPAATLLRPAEAVAAAFDLAALVFILSVIPLWNGGPPDAMRLQSERDDGGQVLLLLLTVGIVLVILVTVARPNAAPALAVVLAAIAEPLRALTHWFDNLSKRS